VIAERSKNPAEVDLKLIADLTLSEQQQAMLNPEPLELMTDGGIFYLARVQSANDPAKT
jgi:hypothetical protein